MANGGGEKLKNIQSLIDINDVYEVSWGGIKGICLILCNWKFPLTKEGKDINLPGYQYDAQKFEKIFFDFGFAVEVHYNQTRDEMLRKILVTKGKIKKDHEAFVCIVLSHGNKFIANNRVYNVVSGADNNFIDLETQLFEKFNTENCKILSKKPKIFFIQACRGELNDSGVDLPEHDGLEPTWADFFICYSSVDGYASCVQADGSRFGKSLASELQNCQGKELTHILTKVTSNICEFTPRIQVNDPITNIPSVLDVKQSVSWETRGWRKLFYFKLNP